ncbi:hypothetical protein BWQ96_06730 [Gracilariopsis chorda]|uniref:Glutathione S-transferase n=1 Tax=Gracilariopsis chorda TaxID=448386 RepID=A0A2V3IF55_9FLOR|nr:hypothetical protein BWQ96_09599 [Gracilariopsis chorda]PXF43529.1 hypothetical protein BWQ96_06730 [Gracilariopsis chorda]|eukprot:PXF40681.1 hypothetical protein BWQ96_09599 [Gracilariopsis chorda]
MGVTTIAAADLKKVPGLEKYSPRRVIPFVVMPDGSSLLEFGAIVMYILETYDKSHKFHPTIGHRNRAKFFQGLFFVATEAYKAVVPVFLLCFNMKHHDRDQEKLKPAKKKFTEDVIGHLEKELNYDYYMGEFSAIDIMFTYVLTLADMVQEDLVTGKAQEYLQRLHTRESYSKVYS